jgi:diaminohydroxyphosphoribosylaminopyrimidine deaminase/5-amino-6-(5-phosphoribosylamino)uracil reductase
MNDEAFMRAAIAAAKVNLGKTAPNPVVGCVLVRDGVILASGATAPGGRPHAEDQALKAAGDARGATAYVTLEPCGARSSGGTPCSQLLVEAGVTRVVVACDDPSPFAAGRGAERLRAAGVAVEVGLLAEEAMAALDYAAWFASQTP